MSVVINVDHCQIYRCWIVYSRSWPIIIIPAILWAADAACGCLFVWKQTTQGPGQMVTNGEVKPFLTAFYALTIVQNLYTTGSSLPCVHKYSLDPRPVGLILYRIWLVDRETAQFRPARRRSRLQSVMRTFIESGLLYTTYTVLVYCVYVWSTIMFRILNITASHGIHLTEIF